LDEGRLAYAVQIIDATDKKSRGQIVLSAAWLLDVKLVCA